MKYILFYRPPCGAWYVHSHKLYADKAEALEAAAKFLPRGALVAILPVSVDGLDLGEFRL